MSKIAIVKIALSLALFFLTGYKVVSIGYNWLFSYYSLTLSDFIVLLLGVIIVISIVEVVKNNGKDRNKEQALSE